MATPRARAAPPSPAAGGSRHPLPLLVSTPPAPAARRPRAISGVDVASPSPSRDDTSATSPAAAVSRRAALLSATTTAAAAAWPAAAARAAEGDAPAAAFDPLAAAASALLQSTASADPRVASPPLPRIPRAPKIPRAPALRGMSAIVRGTRQLDGRHRGTPPARPPPPPLGGSDGRQQQQPYNPNPSDRTRGGEALADLSRFWRAGVNSFETSDAFGGAETLLGQFLRVEPRAAAQGAAKVLVTLSLDGRPGPGGLSPLSRADVRPAALELRVRAACARLGVASLDHVQLAWQGGDAPGPPPLPSSSSGAAAAAARRRGLFGRGRSAAAADAADPLHRHHHLGTPPLWLDALLALEDLRSRRGGLVRGVGVVGFSAPRLLRALDAGVDVATNLVPLSVVDRRAVSQRGLSALCADRGVALLARGCLAGGFLQDRFLKAAASAARLDTDAKLEYGRVVAACGGWDRLQEQLAALARVARAHPGATTSSVALRWALQQQGVAAAVVGARNAQHVGDLRRAFAFELSEDEMLDLDAAYESSTQPTGDVGEWERGGVW
jgi:aryl-alcohol dehydrogenase-like predicted oxidoreductase